MLRNYSYYTSPGRILQSGFYRRNLSDPSPRRAGRGVVPGRMEDAHDILPAQQKKQAARLIWATCSNFTYLQQFVSQRLGRSLAGEADKLLVVQRVAQYQHVGHKQHRQLHRHTAGVQRAFLSAA